MRFIPLLLALIICIGVQGQDTIPPKVFCLQGINSIPLKFPGCAIVWAKDFNHGSFDNLTSADKLKFYFDGISNKDSIKICCDDFLAAGVDEELLKELQIWVEDEAGNIDSCKVYVVFTDRDNYCPPPEPPDYKILGKISTSTSDFI